MLRLDKRNRQSTVIGRIRTLCGAQDVDEVLEQIGEMIDTLQGEVVEDGRPATDGPRLSRPTDEAEVDGEIEDVPEETHSDFGSLRSREGLKVVDLLADSHLVSDDEALTFLLESRLAALWQEVISGNPEFHPDSIRREAGGVYFGRLREAFIRQYDGAMKLELPPGYDFRSEGELVGPNLMQRVTAYRLLEERRLGNWSGVGSGKTISAVFSAGVVGAGLTVVVAANATVDEGMRRVDDASIGNWSRVIRQVFPDADICVKWNWRDLSVTEGRRSFLVLNYESFQQKWTNEFIEWLTTTHTELR